MKIKVWYIENSSALDEAISRIEKDIPCFVDREFIEMNYSKIEVKSRSEDMAWVEMVLAPLV